MFYYVPIHKLPVLLFTRLYTVLAANYKKVPIQSRHPAVTNLEQKSWKGLRTGKPVRRIFTVSNMPEYLSWFRTTVWSKRSGIWIRESDNIQHASQNMPQSKEHSALCLHVRPSQNVLQHQLMISILWRPGTQLMFHCSAAVSLQLAAFITLLTDVSLGCFGDGFLFVCCPESKCTALKTIIWG